MSKKRTKTLIIIAFILIAALSISLIVAFTRIDKGIKTRDISWTEYSIGAFDESGKAIESKEALITKDFITVDGATFELEEDAKISYQVLCYNADKEYIATVDGPTDGTAVTFAEGTKYMRIQINPTADEDGEISLLEKSGYAKQLTVTVNK